VPGGPADHNFVAEFTPQQVGGRHLPGRVRTRLGAVIAVNPDGTVTVAGSTTSVDFRHMGPGPIDYVVPGWQIAMPPPGHARMSWLRKWRQFSRGPLRPENWSRCGQPFRSGHGPARHGRPGRLCCRRAGRRARSSSTRLRLRSLVESAADQRAAPFDWPARS